MAASAAAVATHKGLAIVAASFTWLTTNLMLLAQIDLGGIPQFAVYGVGVGSPIGFGLILWRQFLKAQNDTEAYLKVQLADARTEATAARAEISALRVELSTARSEAQSERTRSANLAAELASANRALHALNPDLAGRVTILEEDQGDTPS